MWIRTRFTKNCQGSIFKSRTSRSIYLWNSKLNEWTNRTVDTGEQERIGELEDKPQESKEITQIPTQRAEELENKKARERHGGYSKKIYHVFNCNFRKRSVSMGMLFFQNWWKTSIIRFRKMKPL